MKKLFLTWSAVVTISAAITSCGEQYKAMSDEEIKAKATEKFEAEGKAAIETAKAECAANMAMSVDAKLAEMMATAAPADAAAAN
jgi:hypothetical protein